ncbi:hypothetical protein [Bartonella sp. MM73XJBT]|uniref:hypothetical protein n=1 Tax=Bartonella sp. MM73XJBT TaxID=3019095 RepID=UPI00235F7A73|nr:hypothetical protein [Bartonella sp. MM73XJBT]
MPKATKSTLYRHPPVPTSSHKLLPQTPSASFHQHTASSQHEPHFTANPTTTPPCACHSNHIFIKQTPHFYQANPTFLSSKPREKPYANALYAEF